MTIQELIKQRKQLGFTQQEIAEYLLVSKTYISNIESGKRYASESLLEKYRITLSHLSNQTDSVDIQNRVTQLINQCYTANWFSHDAVKEALDILEDAEWNPQLEAEVYVCLSIINRSGALREYGLAITYVQKAIEYYRSNQEFYKVEYGEALFELALIYMRTDKHMLAEEIFNMTHDVLEHAEPKHMYRYLALGNLAMLSSNSGNDLEAIQYLKKCERLSSSVKWDGYRWDSKLGVLYKNQMECLFFYVKANIAECREDFVSAISEYKKCLSFMRDNSMHFEGMKVRELHTLDYIGNLYIKLGDYSNAVKYLIESITEKEKYPISHPSLYLDALNYLTKCYIHTGKYEQAIMYAQKVVDYDSSDIIPKAIALRNLGRVHNQKDHNKVVYNDYLEMAIQVLSKHEAFHKLELYEELISERFAIESSKEQEVHF